MIVVADTSPLNYLIQIGHVDVLQALYRRVVVPPEVLSELSNQNAPDTVRAWALKLPRWVEVIAATGEDLYPLDDLDAGERAAIQLALQIGSRIILIDELDGRHAARRLGLTPCGTLGILKAASLRGELDLEVAIDLLLQTNFAVSQDLIELILHAG